MNNNKATMLFQYEPEEFWQKIRELVRSELQRVKSETDKPITYEVSGMTQKPLYKSHEVCAMLQISRQTLHAWMKEGILKPYKIKSRLFFLWSDLEKLVTPSDNA